MELYELDTKESKIYMDAFDASTGNKAKAGTSAVLSHRKSMNPKKKKNRYQKRQEAVDKASGF